MIFSYKRGSLISKIFNNIFLKIKIEFFSKPKFVAGDKAEFYLD